MEGRSTRRKVRGGGMREIAAVQSIVVLFCPLLQMPYNYFSFSFFKPQSLDDVRWDVYVDYERFITQLKVGLLRRKRAWVPDIDLVMPSLRRAMVREERCPTRPTTIIINNTKRRRRKRRTTVNRTSKKKGERRKTKNEQGNKEGQLT